MLFLDIDLANSASKFFPRPFANSACRIMVFVCMLGAIRLNFENINLVRNYSAVVRYFCLEIGIIFCLPYSKYTLSVFIMHTGICLNLFYHQCYILFILSKSTRKSALHKLLQIHL